MAETTGVAITEEEKSAKILKAEEKLRQAKVELRRAKNEEKKKLRQKQNNHKYMMGGVVAKYFPECYEFSDQEMKRIMAFSFKNYKVIDFINMVKSERGKDEEIETKPEENLATNNQQAESKNEKKQPQDSAENQQKKPQNQQN